MSEALIQNVSDTAFMVAAYRAIESKRPDALFHDPLAETLAGEHGRNIVADLPRAAFYGQWFVIIRTHIIDEFIQRAIAEGVDTIVNLGAGLDTRPYRMELPAGLKWIEVDFPHMIEWKETRLADAVPRCQLERIKLDLADGASRRALLADIAAKSTKALVLTEGVVLYIETQEVAALAAELRAHLAFRYWVVDYLSPVALQHRRRMETKMKMQNAPFRFYPDDYFGFFAAQGWTPKEIRYVGEEARVLKRFPNAPFIMRIVMRLQTFFAGRKRRESFLKMAAYVLFEPAR